MSPFGPYCLSLVPRRIAAACLLLSLTACGGSAPPPPPLVTPQPKPAAPLPVDFVICVDNSASISPSEQGLVRETLMLFADLAGVGDRLVLVRFGDTVQIDPPVEITSDTDRPRFKAGIRAGLDFKGRRSDIRAAIRALEDPALYREPGRSLRVPIVISDGKLEPSAGTVQAAVEETRSAVRGPLAQTAIYAIVTGSTGAAEEIVPGMTGRDFMEREVALTPGRVFHAASLDQLLDAAVLVLRKAKGISSLGEEDRAEFKVDATVEEFSVIVRKRALSGEVLCRAEDIRLEHRAGPQAGATEVTFANHAAVLPNVYWTDDYEHFDLIVVRQPRAGLWRVTLASGRAPQVITKVETPLELRVDARPLYFVNESALLGAMVFDRKTGSASTKPFRLDLHLPSAGTFRAFAAAGDGRYVIDVPGAFAAGDDAAPATGTVEYEVVAQQRVSDDSSDLDPWFVRRSPRTQAEVVSPLVHWQALPDRRFATVGDVSVPVTLLLDPAHPHAPAFETLPTAEAAVAFWDDDTKVYTAPDTTRLDPAASAGGTAYRGVLHLREAGTYRVAFSIKGSTRLGPFVVNSPAVALRVVSLRAYVWLGGGVLLLTGIAWLSSSTARIKGRLDVSNSRGRSGTVVLPIQKVFRSGPDLGGVGAGPSSFELRASRLLFVRPRVVLTVRRGTMTVAPIRKGTPAGRTRLPSGGRRTLLPGKRYQVQWTTDDGTVLTIVTNVSV